MGKRRCRARQPSMWVASADLPRGGVHPFYERLNRVLDEAGFDAFVESQCARFYADEVGRPSLAPGRYVRMLLLGYVEGLDSERAIAWRATDSLSLRQFLDIALHEASPDHSTVWRTRRPIDLETHQAVFHVGAAAAGRRRSGPRQDGGHRCDDAGSQRSVAEHRAPGYGRGLRASPRSMGRWFDVFPALVSIPAPARRSPMRSAPDQTVVSSSTSSASVPSGLAAGRTQQLRRELRSEW